MDDVTINSVDISHHIQRGVLIQLRQQGSQTYQQLKPEGTEGNAFNYHLKNLKRAELIQLHGSLYNLTPKGQRLAEVFSFKSGRLLFRPHAYTHLLVTANNKILLYELTREPLLSWLTLPSGKLHFGDSHFQSIQRELKRRSLRENYKVSPLCVVNLQYRKDGETIIQRPGNIWHIEYSGLLVESETPNGKTAWHEIEMLNSARNLTPEVQLAIERLNSDSREPIEDVIDL